MAQPEFQIPMKRPTYHTYDEDYFDDEENNAMCGILRAIIDEDSFLLRKRNTNHYTSWDIMRARQRGLKVRMIQDGKPNAMVYETGKAAGSHMFKSYVERMYDLKERGIPGAKDLLNSLWGVFWTEVQA